MKHPVTKKYFNIIVTNIFHVWLIKNNNDSNNNKKKITYVPLAASDSPDMILAVEELQQLRRVDLCGRGGLLAPLHRTELVPRYIGVEKVEDKNPRNTFTYR